MRHFFSLHLDAFGFLASMICAVHCMAVPLLLMISTWGGLQVLNNPSIELTVISISAMLALFLLLPAYFRHHKSPKAILLVAAGFVLIGAGRLGAQHAIEIILTSVGALLVAIAHYVNWKLYRNCAIHQQKKNL
jgi:hypothetical protein